MEYPEWISRAVPVEALILDVGFLIRDSFYYGPENHFSQEQWQQLREPLYQPKVHRRDNYLLSSELGESAAELVKYYQDVLRLIAHYRKEIGQQSNYFWMRPVIFGQSALAITFPWYDSWQEAAPLLDALADPKDGLLFDDVEQGWEFHAFAEGNRLFLRKGDFDTGEEHFVIATDRTLLASQIPTVRQRVIHLLQELSAAVGGGYWPH